MQHTNHRGVTIVELLMAMTMTAVIVGAVFTTWYNFNQHTIRQRKKSSLSAEVNALSEIITSQLRRSAGILDKGRNSIQFLSPSGDDTVTYVFYLDELVKNEKPIRLVSKTAIISEFVIEEISQPIVNDNLMVISLHLTFQDEFSNQISIHSLVAVKKIDDYDNEETTKWNF